ncbi:MAG: signal peptidase II [Defluviitaleaceae bacterium]|nr:signal peptidase II [Defluviitaleaceae bacterium]
MRRRNIWIVFCVTTVVLLALDLWLKSWAAANLHGHEVRVLVPGVLGLTYHQNPGAFFGFMAGFGGARWVLACLKVIVLCGLAWYYGRLPFEKRFWFMRLPILLIFIGGLGNLIDRVSLGIVRDMLDFLFMNFAVFNLADVYVTVGVFSLMFVGLFIVKDFPFP